MIYNREIPTKMFFFGVPPFQEPPMLLSFLPTSPFGKSTGNMF